MPFEMSTMVAKATGICSSQVSALVSVQEKGSRNKRKFRADPSLSDHDKKALSPQNECSVYDFSAEKFEATLAHGLSGACDLCGINQDHSVGLKLELGLSSGNNFSEAGPSQASDGLESEEPHDADWSDLTESQLEALVLSNLDAVFKSAIKKIVACGYTEEVAAIAVLRSGLCYGCKDTVSNIVENTLQYLKNGQEIDPSEEQCFEDLEQLEKYVLAEMVCVLRDVRPFFSTGDAMWCLLICDMNISHACAMEGNPLDNFAADEGSNGTSSISTRLQSNTEAKCSELNLTNHCKLIPSSSHGSQPAALTDMGKVPKLRPKNNVVLSRLVSGKEASNSSSDPVEKSFSAAGSSEAPILEENFIVSRKIHSSSTKREYMLRQKSLHLEKGCRAYGSKGTSRATKPNGFGGVILDKKLKSISDYAAVNAKNASLSLSKAMGDDMPPDNGSQSLPNNSVLIAADSYNVENSIPSSLPKTIAPTSPSPVSILHEFPSVKPLQVSANDNELSLSLSAKNNSISGCTTEAPKSCNAGTQYDKSLVKLVPWDNKDEMITKLFPMTQELQNQLHEWTDWANQKVMQAARRLSKDKDELKSLRREKEEVERLKKEKQTLEESTMKKLTEMENALCKASGQVDRANSAVRRLEMENAALRQEMEAAKLHAIESAASCQDVSKREKQTLMKFQSWEKQKILLQEELVTERRSVSQLLLDLEQAKQQQEHQEARWKQEKKAMEELLVEANSLRKEREQLEASANSKEAMIKMKAESNLQKYKDDIQKLEKEISQLRLKVDSSKIAALRQGIDGSHASRLAEVKNSPAHKESWMPDTSELVEDFNDYSEMDGVRREMECVMCLSEEMSVVFLPCAHQVVCTTCNELHEKQGMKDCPSCRSPIQRRIPVRYAYS